MARNEDLWTAAKRREAYVALDIAARKEVAATNTLAYIVRTAIAHGLTEDEVCTAGSLQLERVRALSDPHGSVA